MKKVTLLLSLLLAVLMIFSSCNGGESDITTEPETVDTTAPDAPPVSITSGGVTEYKLIRSDKASAKVTDAFVKLRNTVNEKYGVKMEVGDDFVMPNKEPHAYEIAVGTVNREESAQALEGVGYNDAVIAFIGNRLMITGISDDAVVRAVDLFIEKYLTEGELTVNSTLRVVETAEYAKPGVTIGGVPLTDYVIVYGSSYKDAAAEVADRLGILTGAVIPMQGEKEEPAAHEIAIGAASRFSSKIPAERIDDFYITEGGAGAHLYISANNKTAVEMACSRLCKMITDGDKTDYAVSDLVLHYELPASRDYVNDIESLPLHWELEFQPPEWMLDYDEKYAASMDAGGRLMSCAHRGDMVYYPENSIEGIISSVMMGADMVEIDPRLTKDGVFVLLHDATLTRTTDFEEKAGKNGLPTSSSVADWTYEQLMQLNLKTGTGGSGAKVTPYKIPTLDEAFKVCANRIFIRLDVKGPTDDTPFWEFEKDIWPLMQKYESYSNVIYTWHAWFKANSYTLTDTYRAKSQELSGKAGIVSIGDSGTLANNNKVIRGHDFNPGVRLFVDFGETNYKTYLSQNKTKLDAYKGKLRTYADVHNGNNESHAFYAELYEAGINYHLVNKALSLCQYIAANFEATPKN